MDDDDWRRVERKDTTFWHSGSKINIDQQHQKKLIFDFLQVGALQNGHWTAKNVVEGKRRKKATLKVNFSSWPAIGSFAAT